MSRKREVLIATFFVFFLILKSVESLGEEEKIVLKDEKEEDEEEYYYEDDEIEGESKKEGESEKQGIQVGGHERTLEIEDGDVETTDLRRQKHPEVIVPRGIYGKCEEVLTYTRLVLAQAGFILVFDLSGDPFSCSSMFLMAGTCKIMSESDVCIGKHREPSWCFSTPDRHFYWFAKGRILPNVKQRYLMMDWFVEQPLHTWDRWNEAGLPPKPSKVEVSLGPGFVWVFIHPHVFPNKKERLLLGYRISFMDLQVGPVWDVLTHLEDVVYRCDFPTLRPVHPCPRWRHERVLCVLLTEPVVWTNNASSISDDTNKFVRVESFMLPLALEDRWYSQPVIIPLYNPGGIGSLPNPKGPMFGYGNATSLTYPALKKSYYDYLWGILLGLTLVLLVAGLPLVYYIAWRSGHREAEAVWRDWSESPGNIGIGLGGDTIAWQGKPPWKYRQA